MCSEDAEMGVGGSTGVNLFPLDSKEGIVLPPFLIEFAILVVPADPFPVPLIFSRVMWQQSEGLPRTKYSCEYPPLPDPIQRIHKSKSVKLHSHS